METARQAVEAFVARNGRHDTTVHETVAPAVTHEIVTKTVHQDVTRAVDREVHQDHYHISVQPIAAEEHRGEQHHDEIHPVDEQSFEHDDPSETARRLAVSNSDYRDTVEDVVAERTTTELPTITGEHIHHHVHERIQPVVQKQTYEIHIYHVVVPIREVHHNAAQHYPSSPLPMVTLDVFSRSGGSLTGREERYDAFEGEPRSFVATQDGKASVAPAAAPPEPTVGAQPSPEQQSTTTIASRTAANSGTFRAPTRTPTAPAVTAAQEPTRLSDQTRSPPAPVFSEPTLASLVRSQTVPIDPSRAPTQPTPDRINSSDLPGPSLQRESTVPAFRREPNPLARELTGLVPHHPLMRPPTLLTQDTYRQGPARAATQGPAPHQHLRSRSTRARPNSTPSTPAEQGHGTETD